VHDLAVARDAAFHGGEAAATLLARTRAAAALAAAIVVPSAASADDVHARLQPRGRVHVVPFGSDHVPSARPPHPLGGRPFALMLGTIEPRKNHLRLLAAWRTARRERPLLVVVGRRGWQCTATVAALRAAAAAGWLQWRHGADDAEVFALLAHARMLAYPSLWEGFGFPPLEAMALGTPVVAGDCAPLRELCGDAARFCDPTDVDAIAAAVDAVLDDAALRKDLAARGRRRAAAFTWQRCAAQHAAIYTEVSR
jgi:alpha-1,3-rhamnosyl/mannosyltransferase